MKFLLDTCTLSDFARNEEGTSKAILGISPSVLCVSVITIMEIEYGLQHNPAKAKKLRPIFSDIFKTISVLPFFIEEAKHAASIRQALAKIGKPIGPYDILIAATAMRHDLIVVTSNIKEFERVPSLRVENWRKP